LPGRAESISVMNIIILAFVFKGLFSQDAVSPTTCNDLLTNYGEYINFLDTTAELWYYTKPKMSEKVLNLLSVRRHYETVSEDATNPVNELIKNHVCSCYDQNSQKIFTADSPVIKDYLTKNIDKMIKEAQDEFVALKVKQEILARSVVRANKFSKNIEKLKEKTYASTKTVLDRKVQLKIKSR
jgi:hypothetical protein